MANIYTKQDYVNMVFFAMRAGSVGEYTTVSMMKDYCIENSQELDEGDVEKIDKLVFGVLTTMKNAGYLTEYGSVYKIKKQLLGVDLVLEDDVPRLKSLTEERARRVNQINFNLADEPIRE